MSQIELKVSLSYEGLDADNHQLEAHSAALSLEGMAWAMQVATYSLANGKIKERGDLSDTVKIFITSSKKGSFVTTLLILVVVPAIVGYTVNLTTPDAKRLLAYIFNKALGNKNPKSNRTEILLKKIEKYDKNLVEELVHQIEPALERAHNFVGKTATRLEVKLSSNDNFCLDKTTKEYVEAKPTGKYDTIDTNITAYNVNSHNGRLYHPVDEETISMTVIKNTKANTKNKITESLNAYQEGKEGKIRITAEKVSTKSGRLKKYLISDADYIPQSDWVNGIDPLHAKRI